MPYNLKESAIPVKRELRYFENNFRTNLKSEVGLINQITKYLLRQKSKKIRPLLVLLSADICGGITESSYRAATMVELLHTATLLHDDVVDLADTRRGFASINAIWKNKIAILMGDYFLSKGLLISVENNDLRFLKITSNAVKKMSEGELLQIQKSKSMDIDEKVYFDIISGKTAALLSACCELGAVSATKDEEKITNMRSFGENIGMAFQIQDDLLDYLGEKSILGKAIGMDLKERKLTLPLIFSLKNASKSDVNKVIKTIKNNPKKRQIGPIIEFVKKMGGIEYSSLKAMYFISNALESLKHFPESLSKKSLMQLSEFVITREY